MTSKNIWATFCNMKFKGFVLELLVEKYQKLERRINIFLALASSGSIAAWAIWNQFPLIWSLIIALSQVITTIKPFFPYYKIAKELNSKCLSINMLNIEYERFYNKVRRNKLSDNVTEQMYYDFNKSYMPIISASDDLIFDTSADIEEKANFKMATYLKTYYNIDIFKPNITDNENFRTMAPSESKAERGSR